MVGGDHYKSQGGEEHWDRVYRLYGPGYFVGNITKYVERYHRKDGLKDLEKALHYVQKLIELETENPSQPKAPASLPTPHLATELRELAEAVEDQHPDCEDYIALLRKTATVIENKS